MYSNKSCLPQLLVCLFFIGLGTSYGQSPLTNEYCNERFDFCLKYSSVLSQKDISSNEDGIILRSDNQDIHLRVFGYHNMLDNNAAEELDNYFDMVNMEHPKLEAEWSSASKNDLDSNAWIRVGRIVYFVRTIVIGEDIIGLTFEVNRTKLLSFEEAEQIAKRLQQEIILVIKEVDTSF